ncbi:hypothetical protein BTI_4162 [Burkholderia thailandensis MSMB121]|uniref:hypothetical protein n=1 Tax=Burkholderia humptydooensis TaxID=430531 RepID=UPI0003280E42|nr:hypothetical protein [Burkholderia humptydooensis]AGK49824.1 hypothetical protein BTI_4162 [Burkholderia thailandensis MSMB121]ATF32277.1 hypothetical protein CO709_01800 [Burkholderia thailandensis]KST72343.1 hypothetical protein WS76_28125 [Burkholderia humptydooensis]
MESISALTLSGHRELLRMQAPRPQPVDAPIDLASTVESARATGPVAAIRRAETMIARDDAMLMRHLGQIDAAKIGIASLHQLQIRTILFKVKHEAVTGIVTNLNQSIKTVLNAA